jgi:hypothetical protein
MVGSNQRGIAGILLVVMAFVTIALSFPALVFYGRLGQTERALQDKRGELASLADEISRMQVMMAEAEPLAGFSQTQEQERKVRYEALAIEARTWGQKKWSDLGPKPVEGTPPKIGGVPPLQEQILVLLKQVDAARRRRDDAAARKTEAAGIRRVSEPFEKLISEPRIEYKKELEGKVRQIETEWKARKGPLEEHVGRLQQELSKLETDLTEQVELHGREVERLLIAIGKLQSELAEGRVQTASVPPRLVSYGRILRPDAQQRAAFIDVGSQHRVVPGLRFLVGRVGMLGEYEFKGGVEVSRVFPEMSEVTIRALVDPDRPLVQGDELVNPFYHPKRPVVVAFVGEPIAAGLPLTTQEATQRIRAIGGEVRDKVGHDVDFVIMTHNYEQDAWRAGFDQARLLNLPLVEARSMYRFLVE